MVIQKIKNSPLYLKITLFYLFLSNFLMGLNLLLFLNFPKEINVYSVVEFFWGLNFIGGIISIILLGGVHGDNEYFGLLFIPLSFLINLIIFLSIRFLFIKVFCFRKLNKMSNANKTKTT